MKDLNGKTAIITGGTKGIGLAIAEAMMAEGMNVLITGRTQTAVDEVVIGNGPKVANGPQKGP